MNARVIIWGVGAYYNRYREDILQMNVVALVDNDIEKQGSVIDRMRVISPKEIEGKMYDKIYIMSASINSIKQQMLDLGIPKKRIYYYFDLKQRNTQPIYSYRKGEFTKKRIAIISHEFSVTGAPNCLLYLAKYLIKSGWDVKVGAPYDGDIKEEFQMIGAECFVDERLLTGTLENIEWANESNYIIVNTIVMYYLLRKRNLSLPLIWWLHEPAMLYKSVVPEIINSLPTENIRVYTVSKVADDAFHEVCKTIETKRLMFGIEDCCGDFKRIEHEGIRFIIIGQVTKLKGHDVLVEAIKQLDEEERAKCEFMVVGNEKSKFADDIWKELERLKIKYTATGALAHDDTLELLKNSDVLICASRAETVSMTVVEAMMFGIPTIVSDAAGVVEYIEDGVNGQVFESGNSEDLCKKIKFVLENKKIRDAVGVEGRKVFEEIFEMSQFLKCVDRILN